MDTGSDGYRQSRGMRTLIPLSHNHSSSRFYHFLCTFLWLILLFFLHIMLTSCRFSNRRPVISYSVFSLICIRIYTEHLSLLTMGTINLRTKNPYRARSYTEKKYNYASVFAEINLLFIGILFFAKMCNVLWCSLGKMVCVHLFVMYAFHNCNFRYGRSVTQIHSFFHDFE